MSFFTKMMCALTYILVTITGLIKLNYLNDVYKTLWGQPTYGHFEIADFNNVEIPSSLFCIEFIQDMLDIKDENIKNESEKNIINNKKNKFTNNLILEEFDRYIKIKIYLEWMSKLSKEKANLKNPFSACNEELSNIFLANYVNYITSCLNVYNIQTTKNLISLIVKKTRKLNEDVRKLEKPTEKDLYKYSNCFIEFSGFFLLRKKGLLYTLCISNDKIKNDILQINKEYPDNYICELLENIAINLTKCYLKLNNVETKHDFLFDNVEYLMMCSKIDKFIGFAKKKFRKGLTINYEPFFKLIKKTTILIMDTLNKCEKNKLKEMEELHEFNDPCNLIHKFMRMWIIKDRKLNREIFRFIRKISDYSICGFFNDKWWNLDLYFDLKASYLNLFVLRAFREVGNITEKIEYYPKNNFKNDYNYNYLIKIIYSFSRLTIETMCKKYKESDIKTKYESLCYQIVNDGLSILNEQGKDFCLKIKEVIDKPKILPDEVYEKSKSFFVADKFIENFKVKTIEDIEFILPEILFNALCKYCNIKDDELQVKSTKGKTIDYAYKKQLLKNKIENAVQNLITKAIHKLNITCSNEELANVCKEIVQHINNIFNDKDDEDFWINVKKEIDKNMSEDSNKKIFKLFMNSIKEYRNSLSEDDKYKNIKTNTLGILLPNVFKLFCDRFFPFTQKKIIYNYTVEPIVCSFINLFTTSLEKIFNIKDKSESLARLVSFKIINLFYVKEIDLVVNDIYDFIIKQNLGVQEQKNNEEFDIESMFLKDLGPVKIDRHLVMEILEEVINNFLNTFKEKDNNNVFENLKCIVSIIAEIKKKYLADRINLLIKTEIHEICRNKYKDGERNQDFIEIINKAKTCIFEDFAVADKLIGLALRVLTNNEPNKEKEIIKNMLLTEYNELPDFYNLKNRKHLHETVIRRTFFSLCKNFLLENSTASKKETFKKIQAEYLFYVNHCMDNLIERIYISSLIDLYKKFKDGNKNILKYKNLKEELEYIDQDLKSSNIEDYFFSPAKEESLKKIIEKIKSYLAFKNKDVFQNVAKIDIDKFRLVVDSMFFCSENIDHTILHKNKYDRYGNMMLYNKKISIFSNPFSSQIVGILLKKKYLIEEFFEFGDISKLVDYLNKTEKSTDEQHFDTVEKTKNNSKNPNIELEKGNKVYIFVANLIMVVIKEISTRKEPFEVNMWQAILNFFGL